MNKKTIHFCMIYCQPVISGDDENTKLVEHYVFHFAEITLIKIQYDTVGMFEVILTGVISILSQMVPAQ